MSTDKTADIYRDEPIPTKAKHTEDLYFSDFLRQQDDDGYDIIISCEAEEPLPTEEDPYGFLPEQYTEMKNIAFSSEALCRSYEWLFVKQGTFMETFEDDYDYRGNFKHYYPSYRVMNDFQLRGYFSWRTKVRRGEYAKTSLSFVFVYIYELLNQIGVESPEDGFNKLAELMSEYDKFDKAPARYLKVWLCDYAAYYNIDPDSVKSLFPEGANLNILKNCDNYGDDEVYSAALGFSSYNTEKSAFCRSCPEDYKAVVSRLFRAESAFFAKNRKTNYFEYIFGRTYTTVYKMFGTAVFYDRRKRHGFGYEYSINDCYTYKYNNGSWSCSRLVAEPKKNRVLSDLMRTADAVMREKYDFPQKLKADGITKRLRSETEKIIDDLEAEKLEKKRRTVTIDMSKLDGIRISADAVQKRLLSAEEEYSEAEQQEDIQTYDTASLSAENKPAPQESAESGENPYGLNEDEKYLLRKLLCGEDYKEYFRSRGVMTSVIIESINNKLFDEFSDTVIIYGDSGEEPVEDYIEELKGIAEL